MSLRRRDENKLIKEFNKFTSDEKLITESNEIKKAYEYIKGYYEDNLKSLNYKDKKDFIKIEKTKIEIKLRKYKVSTSRINYFIIIGGILTFNAAIVTNSGVFNINNGILITIFNFIAYSLFIVIALREKKAIRDNRALYLSIKVLEQVEKDIDNEKAKVEPILKREEHYKKIQELSNDNLSKNIISLESVKDRGFFNKFKKKKNWIKLNFLLF